MPTDIIEDSRLRMCMVSDRFGRVLPFSKGLLATSILATGIKPPAAYDVARVIQERLNKSSAESIASEALTQITAQEISRRESRLVPSKS